VAVLRPGLIIDDPVDVDAEVAVVVHLQPIREAFHEDPTAVFGKILMDNRVGQHLTDDDGGMGLKLFLSPVATISFDPIAFRMQSTIESKFSKKPDSKKVGMLVSETREVPEYVTTSTPFPYKGGKREKEAPMHKAPK